MTIQTKIVDKQYIISHQPLKTKSETGGESKNDLTLLNNLLFDPDHLKRLNIIYREATGRGQTYFFKYAQYDCVLKHYWRGGIVAKLNADFYFWNPFKAKKIRLQQTRAVREFTLLLLLKKLKLPAPSPLAACITSSFFGYQADIITETLKNTQSLVQLLASSLDDSLADDLWLDLGATIAKFHSHDIYHDDLNANNILIDNNNKIFIIDFDKGQRILQRKNHGRKAPEWKEENLERLLRSLNKEKAKDKQVCFTLENWQKLLEGYNK